MERRSSFSNFSHSLRNYFREIDVPLFLATVALLVFSAVNLFGIGGIHSAFFQRQIGFVIGAIAVMVVISYFDYRALKNYSSFVLFFYVIGIILLIITLFAPSIRGTRAWIPIGGFSLEPSELMKLALIAVMAKYFSQRHIHINQFRHIIISGIYLGIPLGIILLQPDLGSAGVLLAVWGGMLMAAGINKKHFFILAVSAVAVAYIAFLFVLKPYQKDRLFAFVNPYQDPTGIGYNIIQSKIAIGSGAWLGSGLGKGSQTTLGFLPEAHNDFVFASVTEQFGMIGILAVLGTIIFLISRILAIGERTDNNFAKLSTVGVSIFIFTHTFVSAGVNMGILPITGIPFPFLSYGGSHLLALMVGIGMVQSIKRYG
jgi:rod shape determining protein RodA